MVRPAEQFSSVLDVTGSQNAADPRGAYLLILIGIFCDRRAFNTAFRILLEVFHSAFAEFPEGKVKSGYNMSDMKAEYILIDKFLR